MREPITPTFKTHYEKTLHDYDATTEENRYEPIPEQDLDDLTAVFKEAIAPLTTRLTERLGHTPIYTSVFLPSVFQAWGYRSVLP
jgi:hypothetical protein